MSRHSSSEELPLQGGHRGGINSTNNNTMYSVDIETQQRASRPPPMIYYPEAKQSTHWFPWLIPCVIIANTAMFVYTMYVNNCPKNSVNCIANSLGRFSFQPFKENPLLGPSSSTLLKLGALDTDKIVNHHQGWRLASCMWLHGGVFHLLANMLSLLVIGIRLEREFGFVKIGLVYLVAGFGGSFMSALFVRSGISVGASGALFGLLGAMLSELITNWTIYSNKIASFVMLVLIIVINLGVGLLPHVDNFAHIGGFITGFLLGFVVLIRPQFGWVNQKYLPPGHPADSIKSKYKIYQYVLWIVALCLLITWLTAAPVMLFRGVDANENCSWCHYLSCFPTSKWSCHAQQTSTCLTDQIGNQVNVTCSGNGKSKIYLLSNATDSQLQGLCSEVCN